MKKDHLAGWSFVAPRTGLEPVTYRLTAGRSTIELSGNRLSSEQLQYILFFRIRQ